MKRPFVKMHGLGNDFVLVDARNDGWVPDATLVRRLADRRRGIGFDQFLLIETASERPAGYRVFNADGTSAEQCGNGVRCIARWLADRGELAPEGDLAGPVGRVGVRIHGPSAEVSVEMGRPVLNPPAIPFRGPQAPALDSISGAGFSAHFCAISMGNPHAVIEVADLQSAAVETIATALQRDDRFPDGVNVGFMQVTGTDAIRLRVIERGAGETPACGSGACAATVAGRLWERLGPDVAVHLPGGVLRVGWSDPESPVWLRGPAAYSFEGEFEA